MSKLAIHHFMILLTLKGFYKLSLLIDSFVCENRAIKLPSEYEPFCIKKYKPMNLIRTQSCKMLIFSFLFHRWGCLI